MNAYDLSNVFQYINQILKFKDPFTYDEIQSLQYIYHAKVDVLENYFKNHQILLQEFHEKFNDMQQRELLRLIGLPQQNRVKYIQIKLWMNIAYSYHLYIVKGTINDAYDEIPQYLIESRQQSSQIIIPYSKMKNAILFAQDISNSPQNLSHWSNTQLLTFLERLNSKRSLLQLIKRINIDSFSILFVIAELQRQEIEEHYDVNQVESHMLMELHQLLIAIKFNFQYRLHEKVQSKEVSQAEKFQKMMQNESLHHQQFSEDEDDAASIDDNQSPRDLQMSPSSSMKQDFDIVAVEEDLLEDDEDVDSEDTLTIRSEISDFNQNDAQNLSGGSKTPGLNQNMRKEQYRQSESRLYRNKSQSSDKLLAQPRHSMVNLKQKDPLDSIIEDNTQSDQKLMFFPTKTTQKEKIETNSKVEQPKIEKQPVVPPPPSYTLGESEFVNQQEDKKQFQLGTSEIVDNQENDNQQPQNNTLGQSVMLLRTESNNQQEKKTQTNQKQENQQFYDPLINRSNNDIRQKLASSVFQQNQKNQMPQSPRSPMAPEKPGQSEFAESVLFELPPSNRDFRDSVIINNLYPDPRGSVLITNPNSQFQESVILGNPYSNNNYRESVLINDPNQHQQYRESVTFNNPNMQYRESVLFNTPNNLQESIILNNPNVKNYNQSVILNGPTGNSGQKTERNDFAASVMINDFNFNNQGLGTSSYNTPSTNPNTDDLGSSMMVDTSDMDRRGSINLANIVNSFNAQPNSQNGSGIMGRMESVLIYSDPNMAKYIQQNAMTQNKAPRVVQKPVTDPKLEKLQKETLLLPFNPFIFQDDIILKIQIRHPAREEKLSWKFITVDGATIGRNQDNTIFYSDDITISGKHAIIFFQSGKFLLMDRGSQSGTWKSIQELTLYTGIEIQLGYQLEIKVTSIQLKSENTYSITILLSFEKQLKQKQIILKVGQEQIMGRNTEQSENYINIPDNQTIISKMHAKLMIVQGNVVLVDMDSVNGTWVRLGPKQQKSVPIILQPDVQFQISVIDFSVVSISNFQPHQPASPGKPQRKVLNAVEEKRISTSITSTQQ